MESRLCDKMKKIRLEHKLTQKQMAERLHVQKGTVSCYELGDRLPSYDVLIRFSKIFHVSIDYLLGVDQRKTLDVSDLLDEDVTVVNAMIEALRRKK